MGHLVAVRVLMVTAYQLNVDVVELLAPADVVKNSVQIQLGLLLNIKASQ
jgi:hypothetical protein